MALEKLPKNALPVEDHWEWKQYTTKFHGWADENDLLHREGAPAEIWYSQDGTIIGEWWYLHGKLHREGSPAGIGYRQDGTIEWESWYLHGEPHREGGPAQIWYREDGTITGEVWWFHGEEIEPEYPLGWYQDLQARIGHAAMWTLPGNLIPVLSGFLQ